MSDEMWTAFEQYQPYADAQGHGESWRKMTQERTSESMRAARSAAWAAEYAASAVWWAEAAAEEKPWPRHLLEEMAWAVEAAEAAAKYEARAIEYITQAINEAQS